MAANEREIVVVYYADSEDEKQVHIVRWLEELYTK